MSLVCKECQKAIYKKFEYRCFTCKPLRPTAQEKAPSFKKAVLLHACHTPEKIAPIPIREERSKIQESHPIVKAWEQNDFTIETMVKNHTLRVLDLCHGNKAQTASILGITIRTLYNKLIEYGVHIPHEGMVQ